MIWLPSPHPHIRKYVKEKVFFIHTNISFLKQEISYNFKLFHLQCLYYLKTCLKISRSCELRGRFSSSPGMMSSSSIMLRHMGQVRPWRVSRRWYDSRTLRLSSAARWESTKGSVFDKFEADTIFVTFVRATNSFCINLCWRAEAGCILAEVVRVAEAVSCWEKDGCFLVKVVPGAEVACFLAVIGRVAEAGHVVEAGRLAVRVAEVACRREDWDLAAIIKVNMNTTIIKYLAAIMKWEKKLMKLILHSRIYTNDLLVR